jgi:hypothetical protein
MPIHNFTSAYIIRLSRPLKYADHGFDQSTTAVRLLHTSREETGLIQTPLMPTFRITSAARFMPARDPCVRYHDHLSYSSQQLSFRVPKQHFPSTEQAYTSMVLSAGIMAHIL